MKYNILFNNVSFVYCKDVIFQDISFFVKPGDILSFIGKSGSGKTTILRLLASLEKPSKGSIEVLSPVSYMTQYPLLLPRRNIMDNLMLLYELDRLHTCTKQEWKEKALFFLNEVGLHSFADFFPKELSGGMQSRVALARVLLEDKPILLLDEPFVALDAITREGMQRLVLSLQEKYLKTILLVTHDIFEAVRLSSRVLLLAEARIKKSWDIPKDAVQYPAIASEVLQALL